jgi:hypothetical protein
MFRRYEELEGPENSRRRYVARIACDSDRRMPELSSHPITTSRSVVLMGHAPICVYAPAHKLRGMRPNKTGRRKHATPSSLGVGPTWDGASTQRADLGPQARKVSLAKEWSATRRRFGRLMPLPSTPTAARILVRQSRKNVNGFNGATFGR